LDEHCCVGGDFDGCSCERVCDSFLSNVLEMTRYCSNNPWGNDLPLAYGSGPCRDR
jgi:hypothetical protein